MYHWDLSEEGVRSLFDSQLLHTRPQLLAVVEDLVAIRRMLGHIKMRLTYIHAYNDLLFSAHKIALFVDSKTQMFNNPSIQQGVLATILLCMTTNHNSVRAVKWFEVPSFFWMNCKQWCLVIYLDGSHDHFIHEPVQELLSERIAGWVWFATPTRRRQLQPFTTRQLHTEKKSHSMIGAPLIQLLYSKLLQIHSKRKKLHRETFSGCLCSQS